MLQTNHCIVCLFRKHQYNPTCVSRIDVLMHYSINSSNDSLVSQRLIYLISHSPQRLSLLFSISFAIMAAFPTCYVVLSSKY